MTWLMIRQNGVFNTWISIIKELEFDRRVIDVFLYYGLGWKMYWTSILALQLLTFSDTECTKVWIPSEKLLRFLYAFFMSNWLIFHHLFSIHFSWLGLGTLHGVGKLQKKSYSTLKAKSATFTLWVDKSSLKAPKMVHFCEFLKTWSLRPNSVTRQVSFK